ncbi:MAG: hypothetical protein LAP38_05920 [Acidobacteriia bacterium]|nr:hypothetical protein [Terriglobia bacterium]
MRILALRFSAPALEFKNSDKPMVIRLLPGCYVWIASLVALPITALIQKLKVAR